MTAETKRPAELILGDRIVIDGREHTVVDYPDRSGWGYYVKVQPNVAGRSTVWLDYGDDVEVRRA